MNSTGVITIGPLNVPTAAAAVVLVLLVSYLAGVLRLRKDSESRKAFSDIYLTPLLPFILGWKLSLVITDFSDVLDNPLMLLYATGGLLNFLIGLVPAVIFTVIRWRREPRRKTVSRALILSGISACVLSGLLFLLVPGTEGKLTGQLPPVYVTDEYNNQTDLRDGGGKPVIINFWASWCPPCRAEMPMLETAMADSRFSGAVFYTVNVTVTEKAPDQGRKWLEDNGLDMPLYFDTNGDAMTAFGVELLPTTIVLDRQGQQVVRKSGVVSRSWLLSGLRKAKK